MASFTTHYDNLRVARNAPFEVIKAAYKALSQKYHPDKHPDDPNAGRRMQIINLAYDTLCDPAKRAEHDREIAEKEAAAKREQELEKRHNMTEDPDNAAARATREARRKAFEEAGRAEEKERQEAARAAAHATREARRKAFEEASRAEEKARQEAANATATAGRHTVASPQVRSTVVRDILNTIFLLTTILSVTLIAQDLLSKPTHQSRQFSSADSTPAPLPRQAASALK